MGDKRGAEEHRCPDCGKTCYTFTGARAAAARSRRRNHERMQSYRCRSGWWHVGHEVLRKPRRR